VLLTDEDYDGYSIRCLLIAFFYYYYPLLLKTNKIFIGRTPLYCKDVKGKRLYAFTEEEVENFPKTGELLRRKGLGALTEEDISNTIFSKNPFEQVLEFKQNEYEEFVELLEIFMGDNIEKRREYVEQIDF
jgi:topoisomerase-4 subunit B